MYFNVTNKWSLADIKDINEYVNFCFTRLWSEFYSSNKDVISFKIIDFTL